MADINVDEDRATRLPGRRIPGRQAELSGAIAAELKPLIDSNTVRVLDLVGLTKAHDGSVEASELRDRQAAIKGA